MNQRTVLIADIIQSRKSEDRYAIQKKMVLIIGFLNKSYENNLVRKVEISSGDSFQGLFDNPGSAFLYIRMAQMLLYPTKIRAGIGVGTLDYMDKNFGTNLLDGEAYHNAKTAIDAISSTRKEAVFLYIKNSNLVLLDAINVMFNMYYKLRQIFRANSLSISLVNELLNPMSVDGEINYLDNINDLEIDLISEIIQNSSKHRRENSEKITNNLSSLSMNKTEPFIILKSYIHERKNISSSDFVLRGIQDNVANVIGTSRQNVQKYYAKGVADERAYTASLVNCMNEVMK
ncbi:MAG: SatD family protein [Breznakia sp.]